MAADGEAGAAAGVRLGMRANRAQFLYLLAISALVGATVGQERAVVPLLATRTFGLSAVTTATSFIVAYGLAKAVTNLVAATVSDRVGRRPVMIVGWAIGVTVPLLLMWAPSWSWVVVANLLLGAHDGLTSSTLVIMTTDVVRPDERGTAMGISAGVGYLGVAAAAFAAGLVAARFGLRPDPFFVGLACALAGLAIAVVALRDTHAHARHEAASASGAWRDLPERLAFRRAFTLVSFRERSLSACSQAGFCNNLNDAVAWGVFPLLFAARGLGVREIALLAALYPAVWGLGQFATGGLSDRWGRRRVIIAGMWVQALALLLVVPDGSTALTTAGVIALGVGTALVYPTLLAAVGDTAHPAWRGAALGVYRLWRDAGLVVGALVGGAVADAFGLQASVVVVAAVTAASGVVVALRMAPDHAVRASA